MLRQDGRELFERCVVPLRAEFMRKAMRLTRNAADAEDLVQETLCKALASASAIEDPSRARAWAHSILHNTFVSMCRRNAVRASTPLDPVDIDAMADHAPARQPDLAFDLERALAGLDETFRDAVLLCDVEGLQYLEAAQELGCPPGTFMSRLHRGRLRIRHSLEELTLD